MIFRVLLTSVGCEVVVRYRVLLVSRRMFALACATLGELEGYNRLFMSVAGYILPFL